MASQIPRNVHELATSVANQFFGGKARYVQAVEFPSNPSEIANASIRRYRWVDDLRAKIPQLAGVPDDVLLESYDELASFIWGEAYRSGENDGANTDDEPTYQDGYDAGYDAGYTTGHKEGLKEGRAESED